MVRFSCFHPHIHNHKPKKTGQPPAESMHKALQDRSRSEVSKDSPRSIALNQSLVKTASDNQISNSANHMALIIENGRSANQTCGFKKSQSLGSMPYGEGSSTADNDTEYGIDNQGFSCENSQYRLEISDYGKDQEISSPDRFKENTGLNSFHLKSDPVIREVIFSIDDSPHREKEDGGNSDSSLFRESVGDFGKDTPHATHMIVKSCSMPNIDASSPVSSGGSPYKSLVPHSRSSGELHLLDSGVKEMSLHEIEVQVNGCHSIADDMPKTEKINFEISKHDDNDSHPGVVQDWIVPVVDKVIIPMENLRGEPMVQYNDEFPGNDFKIKRIEEWVSDLQLCSPPDEATEVYQSSDEVKKDLNIIVGSSTARIDTKVTAGMEAAKRYISSMNAASTTAQLANYGLVVIPFLSAFVGLKVLNLSSNSIVKITAGVLPRGLHMLNLSKNSIATIEGLRELTRLRLLDLSYNRIFRIGHGLASCSSLKELYLAGNKISEVEGLHRLLKLSILDLRCNKISTIKSLGQLAANYNSLQAISLEGNPAQKNVGDDQLKKQLQGLLPHLVYYNRQPTKGSILKDGADRSVRLGVSGHQFDHGIRSDHKNSRKLAHGSPARPSSSSTHGHRSHGFVSPRGSRLRHGHISALPPTGNKVISRHHHFDISSRPLEFKADSFIRRSRSEGTLADL